MVLERGGSPSCSGANTPSACPASWTEVDFAPDILEVGSNCRRVCVRTDRACLVIRLERSDPFGGAAVCTTNPAPACPALWSQADVGRVDSFGTNCRRTCFFCP